MGNNSSMKNIVDEDLIAAYAELTYLKKAEISNIIKKLDKTNPGKLRQNLEHRFEIEEIETILPQIRCSPFRSSIYRVFSSNKDGHLSLQDVLDLCSAFSKNCPDEVRASWAFRIFDFDGDNQISSGDLIEAVRKLTCNEQLEHATVRTPEAEHVARMVLQEMVFNGMGTISSEEFVRFVSRISEFPSTFCFKI